MPLYGADYENYCIDYALRLTRLLYKPAPKNWKAYCRRLADLLDKDFF
jgi:hypothetical protein